MVDPDDGENAGTGADEGDRNRNRNRNPAENGSNDRSTDDRPRDERSSEASGSDANGETPASQTACTRVVLDVTPEAAVVSNLGVASYVLAGIEDRERNFYMRGAMGTTTPVGFGLALSVDDPVTVLEGDGSLLMSLGALATVGTYDPPNLTVVVFDNREYATTGGQSTLSTTTNFAGVARNCGVEAWAADTCTEFEEAYREAIEHDGTGLVACHVYSDPPAERPSLDDGHSYLKHRFRIAMTR